eukprot:747164-Hanusia_phi.AAC.8
MPELIKDDSEIEVPAPENLFAILSSQREHLLLGNVEPLLPSPPWLSRVTWQEVDVMQHLSHPDKEFSVRNALPSDAVSRT